MHKGDFPAEAYIGAMQNLTEAFPIATYLVNSADELEPEACRALREPIPFTGEVAKVVPVGPLEQLFASKGGEADSFELSVAKKSKKLHQVKLQEWLDEQPDSSVVYIYIRHHLPPSGRADSRDGSCGGGQWTTVFMDSPTPGVSPKSSSQSSLPKKKRRVGSREVPNRQNVEEQR